MENPDHLLANYYFELPERFIAQRPLSPRDSSRLLVYHSPSGEVEHTYFRELHRYLPPDSTLILNDSKVFPCRLLGQKETGGQAEIFLLSAGPVEGLFPALIKCSGKKKPGNRYTVDGVQLQLVKSGAIPVLAPGRGGPNNRAIATLGPGAHPPLHQKRGGG